MLDEKPSNNGLDARFESKLEKTGFVLQDDMLWAILEDKRFTVKDRGSWWPADFNNKGDVSITRRPRGRPASMRKMALLSGILNILPTHLDINRHHQLLFFLALF